MKVSLNWIREFLDLDKTPEEIADILTSLGLEVEGWDTVKPSPVDLDKVLTGQVLECAPIPDTDHLSATRVDVGDGTVRSIVCGAPNVAAGQRVLVALPGARVFSKDGQLFEIGERKVRGVPSQGMICAEDELGIGHDHSGILVLPADTPLGIPASRYLNLPSDTVYEIGLTPNRADATNHLGVARDLLAWVRQHENPQALLKYNLRSATYEAGSTTYAVEVENTEACHRYTGLLIRGVRVGESPDWLKDRLLALGQRPINNVVDITNYVRLELGQPLHAFDADQIRGNRIIVKTLPEGTVFKTLDEVERKLSDQDLMICDGESNPMCMGGVFGGATSGVTEATVNVFLESARFNPTWIRRSMLRHGLRTDAAWNFEKGVDPNGCLAALHRATDLILEWAGGVVASEVTDIYPNPVPPARVPVEYARVHALIGENLPKATIKNILTALEIGIENETHAGFTAAVPTNKPDVTREADIIEEILRVYGLDAVPMPTRMRTSMEITPKPDPDAVRNLAADFLSANGFFECMSLSLSNSAYHTGAGALLPLPKEALVFVHNTANQGLDCLRPTLLFSGLETICHNQNRQNPDLRLYEFGKTYEAAPPVPPQRGGDGLDLYPFGRDGEGLGRNRPSRPFPHRRAQPRELAAGSQGERGFFHPEGLCAKPAHPPRHQRFSGNGAARSPFPVCPALPPRPEGVGDVRAGRARHFQKNGHQECRFLRRFQLRQPVGGISLQPHSVSGDQQIPRRAPRPGFGVGSGRNVCGNPASSGQDGQEIAQGGQPVRCVRGRAQDRRGQEILRGEFPVRRHAKNTTRQRHRRTAATTAAGI